MKYEPESNDSRFKDIISRLFSKDTTGRKLGSSMFTDVLSNIVDEKKQSLTKNMDPRVDPTNTLNESAALDTGKSILSGAARGAAFGPAGIIIGAATAGLGRLVGMRERVAERTKIQKDWSDKWSSQYGSEHRSLNYKKGGKIRKKKSISISKAELGVMNFGDEDITRARTKSKHLPKGGYTL